ncbi:hypothetical protein BH20ACI3_BH20ACI3_20440 [soil metagenome]
MNSGADLRLAVLVVEMSRRPATGLKVDEGRRLSRGSSQG